MVTVKDLTKGDPAYSKLLSEVKKIMPELSKNLWEKGVDLSKYTVNVTNIPCAVNARAPKGKIEICPKFLNYTRIDQTVFLWHEIYHIEKDIPVNFVYKELTNPIIMTNVPTNIKNFINNVLLDGINIYKEAFYTEELTVYNILPPQCYQNEIAAYEAEIARFPNSSVSAQYAAEREYLLWGHRERLKIAKKYYITNN